MSEKKIIYFDPTDENSIRTAEAEAAAEKAKGNENYTVIPTKGRMHNDIRKLSIVNYTLLIVILVICALAFLQVISSIILTAILLVIGLVFVLRLNKK